MTTKVAVHVLADISDASVVHLELSLVFIELITFRYMATHTCRRCDCVIVQSHMPIFFEGV